MKIRLAFPSVPANEYPVYPLTQTTYRPSLKATFSAATFSLVMVTVPMIVVRELLFQMLLWLPLRVKVIVG
jgi:hypothetical protein